MFHVKRWRWQAPPNWPWTPPGWTPPPGWQPPPDWPEPPQGWQWWQRIRRTRWQRLRLALLIGFAVVILGALIAAEVADSITGCGSVDPTDPANYSVVAILNDTPRPVVIAACPGAYCDAARLPVRLAPGQSFTDDAACGATGTDMTSWRVTRIDGKVLGYIAVDSPRSRDGLVYKVSHASPNRHSATSPS
jgi:hypothetical protein